MYPCSGWQGGGGTVYLFNCQPPRPFDCSVPKWKTPMSQLELAAILREPHSLYAISPFWFWTREGGWVKKHPPLDNDKNQTKLVLWQLFSIHLQMVHVLQCVHLHYLCLEITTHPNVRINIGNQGPLPLVRGEKGEHPWERRERGAFHWK